MGLVTGSNTTHYWEDSGIIGRLYDQLLGFDGIYAWDIWFIYRAGVEWTGRLPPEPDFTMHQLGPLAAKFDLPFLDSEVFASEVNRQLALVGDSDLDDSDPSMVARSEDPAAGPTIDKISQPAGVAIGQHIKGRGGYRNIKQIESIRIDGELTAAGESGSIGVVAARGAPVAFDGPTPTLGLPPEIEDQLLSNFELDGTLVEWKDKGHDIAPQVHMEKLPGHLAWVLDVTKSDGSEWRFYIDSHGGHLLRQTLLDAQGDPLATVEYGGHQGSSANPLPQTFRLGPRTTLEHYVLPNWISYRDADNREVSRIDISEITVRTREEG